MPRRTHAEQAQHLAVNLQRLADILLTIETEGSESLFRREDVEKIVEDRLTREYKKRAEIERERDELREEVRALRGRMNRVDTLITDIRKLRNQLAETG